MHNNEYKLIYVILEPIFASSHTARAEIMRMPKLIMLLLPMLIAFSGVLSAAEPVRDTCRRIAGKLASVRLQECLGIGLHDSGYRSELGTPLLIKEYPPLAQRQPHARILLLGGIHGDEYSAVTINFKWMKILDQYHSGLFHWQIAPLVNPDGLLRKHSRRVNANGVDLNRNFAFHHPRMTSISYWEQRTNKNPRRYPGGKPESEKETLWIKHLIQQFRPDAIVTVHAPYGIVDFDGPKEPPRHLGPLHLHLLGTYPGSLGNYAGLQLDIPVVTVELPYAGIMPSDGEISRIWTDLVRWLVKRFPQPSAERTAMTGTNGVPVVAGP